MPYLLSKYSFIHSANTRKRSRTAGQNWKHCPLTMCLVTMAAGSARQYVTRIIIPEWALWLAGILIFVLIIVLITRRNMKAGRKLNNWLDEHFRTLSPKQQKALKKLRNKYRPGQRPRYGRNWPEKSQKIRKDRPKCEICGARTRHVHHKRYRRFRDRPRDLIALCNRCHYYIHPRSPMTKEAFERRK